MNENESSCGRFVVYSAFPLFGLLNPKLIILSDHKSFIANDNYIKVLCQECYKAVLSEVFIYFRALKMNHFSMMMIVASGVLMLASLLIVDTASPAECTKDSHTVSLTTEMSIFKVRNHRPFLYINLRFNSVVNFALQVCNTDSFIILLFSVGCSVECWDD